VPSVEERLARLETLVSEMRRERDELLTAQNRRLEVRLNVLSLLVLIASVGSPVAVALLLQHG